MNNQPSTNLEGIIAGQFAGVPVLQHSRIETTLNRFEINASNRGLSRIITVSADMKRSYLRQGIDSDKCVVVYNGIDSETKILTKPLDIRSKFAVNDDDILIGSVGSLLKRKRMDDFIAAIAQVSEMTDVTVKAIIVGDGPQREALEQRVYEKGLTDRIFFVGFQSDAISYVNAMDIFVLASEKEGLPRVVLEAMLLGKPVVASCVTGTRELVKNEETGFLVELRNVGELAKAMLRLIESPQLRATMGAKGKERVITHFSIQTYVAGVEAVFAEIFSS